MMEEFDLYEENSYGNRLIATFHKECDILNYIEKISPKDKYNYFIMKRESEERRISIESFKGICSWKINKCK